MNDSSIPPRPQFVSATPQVAETPTQAIVKKKPPKTAEVTDELNRVILIRRLEPLDRMRLAKMVGTDSKNDVYMGYAALAYSVVKIDGEDVSVNTMREIEFLVSRLGDEGLTAVGEGIEKQFMPFLTGADPDAAKN